MLVTYPMASIVPPRGPTLQRIISCRTESSNSASFHWGDLSPVIRSSPLVGSTPASATTPTSPRRKSSLRVKPDQSQYPVDRNADSSKKVHFDDLPEQTRVFSSADAPSSLESKLCSGTSVAVNAELLGYNTFQLNRDERICTLNAAPSLPSPWQPVRLQNLELLPSGCMIKGTIAVLNLAFQKRVSVRFTFDGWKTVSDVAAEHFQSLLRSHTIVYDLFSFMIDAKSPPLDTHGRLQICVSYQVVGEEFWDNNAGENYVIVLNV